MAVRFKRNQLVWILVLACLALTFYSINGSSDNDMPFRHSTESRLSHPYAAEQENDASHFRTASAEEVAHGIKGPHVENPDMEIDRKIQAAIEKQQTSSAEQGHATNGAYSDEQSVAGRKMMPKPKEKPKWPVAGEEKALNGGKIESATDEATLEAKAYLDDILKRGPIIIFSKSYCGFSKRAKHLLLDTYTITPTPYVVELDLLTDHLPRIPGSGDEETVTLGKKLQDLLAELTGRKTVPNILVNARSIGGSDDLAKLEEEGELVEEIKRLGGAKIRGMTLTRKGD